MAHALEPGSGFVTALHHEPGVGLGRVGLGFLGSRGDVVWNADRTRGLVMEGELYDTAPLLDLLCPAHPPHVSNHAELILRLYERFGPDVLSRLNGAFAVAMWDRAERQLTVFNDRLGLFPIYYAEAGNGLVVGSGVRALLAEPALSRSVDRVALNEFLVFDHLLGDRTLLSSVHLLPQASVLTFREGQLNIRPYWTLKYPERYQPRAEGEYIEGFVHHLRQAVLRQKPDGQRSAVLLSGGLDSRLLIAPLVEDGVDLETLTFGIPGCDDAAVAEEVAAKLRTRHHFFELKPDWLLGMADEAVRVTDGLGNIVNLHVIATRDEQARHAEVVYKGFNGDALFGFALKRQMWADYTPADRIEVHLGVHDSQGVINYTRAEQKELFTDSFQRSVGNGAYESYRDGMDRAGVTQLANERLYFDLTQRVPRMTLNGVEAARTRTAVRLPFCDNDLLDFALTVPPGFMFERHLSKRALMDYFPYLAQIPIASTGRPLSACARDLWIQAKTLASWHLRNKGLGWLAARERRPYKDYDNWFRTILRPWVEGVLLAPRSLERGYFNPGYVRGLVAAHMAGANYASRLGTLLTIELWHRQFLD